MPNEYDTRPMPTQTAATPEGFSVNLKHQKRLQSQK